MKLKELLQGLDVLKISADVEAEITGVAYDSQSFACRYIKADVIDRLEAVSALAEANVQVPDGEKDLLFLISHNPSLLP